MTVLQRAATIAVMTFSLTGLLGHSTPVQAQNAPIVGATSYATAGINAADLPMVPHDATLRTETPDLSEDDDFDSLAEAVAAQDDETVDGATRCLAGAIYFESNGEPLAGQLAVAQVIINRAKSGRFPADVCGVVKQRGQFSFVRGGEIPAIDTGRESYRTAIAVAQVAMTAAWDSAAPSALYFNTPNRAPGARLVKVAAIGNHVFYR